MDGSSCPELQWVSPTQSSPHESNFLANNHQAEWAYAYICVPRHKVSTGRITDYKTITLLSLPIEYIYTISCDVQNHIYYLNEHFCIVCPIIRQIVNFMEILVEIYNNKVRSRNQCNGQVKEIKGWNYSYLLNWFDEGGCLHYLPMK